METLRENYPPAAFYSAMNFLGTHDTPRILTVLGAGRTPETKEERAGYRLSPAELRLGAARVALAALVLFTFPGSPTVYYGDEIGMEGWEDPFNRGTFPWGSGDEGQLAHFRRLGRLRRDTPALRQGAIEWLHTAGPLLVYARTLGDTRLVTVVNAARDALDLTLDWRAPEAVDLLTGQSFPVRDGRLSLTVPALGGLLLQ
jgi:4-alpha-glucanotransferase